MTRISSLCRGIVRRREQRVGVWDNAKFALGF